MTLLLKLKWFDLASSSASLLLYESASVEHGELLLECFPPFDSSTPVGGWLTARESFSLTTFAHSD